MGDRWASTERLEPLLGVWSLGGVRGIAREIQEARCWAELHQGADEPRVKKNKICYKIRFKNNDHSGAAMKTQDEILSFIRKQVPRAHFEELQIVIPTAFEKAHRASNELIHIPKNRKRAQDRYSFLQDGLAGLSKTWSSTVTPTEPSGEFYTLMMAGNIKITAAVKPWRKKIRPAKYRLSNSRLNKFLTSPQMDFLGGNDNSLAIDDTLNAVIIPFAPSPYMNQAAPLDILIAVPYFNSSDNYHVWCSLNDFLKGYENESVEEFKDTVWPTLRQRMRNDEGNAAESGE